MGFTGSEDVITFSPGQGVAQDYNEAVKWLKLAAEKGNEEAIEALKTIEENNKK